MEHVETDSGLQFYNTLGGSYHLIFANWQEAVEQQMTADRGYCQPIVRARE